MGEGVYFLLSALGIPSFDHRLVGGEAPSSFPSMDFLVLVGQGRSDVLLDLLLRTGPFSGSGLSFLLLLMVCLR